MKQYLELSSIWSHYPHMEKPLPFSARQEEALALQRHLDHWAEAHKPPPPLNASATALAYGLVRLSPRTRRTLEAARALG